MELSFLTPTKFSTLIEEMVQEKNLTYMDACLEYCKDKNVSTTKNNERQEDVMSIHNALLCVYGGADRNCTDVLKVI